VSVRTDTAWWMSGNVVSEGHVAGVVAGAVVVVVYDRG
jgi:hypothetical protein